MRQSPDRLVLFTQGFPYEKGETFLLKEIEFLSAAFEKILIIPSIAEGKVLPLPKNVSVKVLPEIWQVTPELKKKVFKKYWFSVCRFFVGECLAQFRNRKVWELARQNFALSQYFFALVELMEETIKEFSPERTIYYSYWCNDRATLIGILKQSGRVKIAISRAHSFDLYANHYPYIRFRPFQVMSLNSILPISEHGTAHLKDNFPFSRAAFRAFKLGVPDGGWNPFDPEAIFTIVTCSIADSRKRVLNIANVISQLPFETRWVHFGSGPDLVEIKTIADSTPSHIKIELPGFVPNEKVLEFFRSEPIHVFLNFSTIEGIPFSMMEAISCGIPVLGVDICAVSEIVTPLTGILLPENATEKELMAGIEKFRNFEKFGIDFREGVKKFWAENYEDKNNFGEFVNYLKQL